MEEAYLWRGTPEQRTLWSSSRKSGQFNYFDKQHDHPDWSHKAVLDFGKAQLSRLQTAMVTQRTWPALVWKDCVLAHPVLGLLCQRLVWMDQHGRTFRPAEDLSLTDLDDTIVCLGEGDTVVLPEGRWPGPVWVMSISPFCD